MSKQLFVAGHAGNDVICHQLFVRKRPLRESIDVRALFVDYGQMAARQEQQAAKQITQHFGIDLRCVKFSGMASKSDGEISGVNQWCTHLTWQRVERKSNRSNRPTVKQTIAFYNTWGHLARFEPCKYFEEWVE